MQWVLGRILGLRAGSRWRLGWLLGLIVLSGCASTAPQEGARQMTEDEGVVRVFLTSNTGQVASWSRIEVTRVSGGSPTDGRSSVYSLVRAGGAQANGVVTGGVPMTGILPKGIYVVTRLHDDRSNQFVDIQKNAERLGGFFVHPGLTTDLGTLLVSLRGRGVAIARIDVPQPGGWGSSAWDRPDPGGAAVIGYASENPAGIFDLTELPNGRIVAGGRMGTVLVREQPRTWRQVRVGRLEDVYATSTYPGSGAATRFVVGGEGNLLAVVDERGVSPVAATLPPGNIVALHHNQAGTAWFLLSQDQNLVLRAFRASSLTAGSWTELYAVKLETGFDAPFMPLMTLTKHATSVTVAVENLKDDVMVNINFESGAVRNIKTSKLRARLAPTVAGILSTNVWGWSSRQMYSFDEGASWNALPEDLTSLQSTLFLPRSVLIFRDGQPPDIYPVGDPPVEKLMISSDGGQAWQPLPRAPDGKWYVVPSGILFVSPRDGMNTRIYESTNNGASWAVSTIR